MLFLSPGLLPGRTSLTKMQGVKKSPAGQAAAQLVPSNPEKPMANPTPSLERSLTGGKAHFFGPQKGHEPVPGGQRLVQGT